MGLIARLKSWFGLEGKLPPGFYKIKGQDGRVSIVDQVTMDYLKSMGPAPSQESLDAVLGRTRKARIYSGGTAGLEPSTELLLEVEAQDDRDGLSDALRIKPGSAGHCMCFGDPTLELLGEAGQRLALISIHHGLLIRWPAWKGDAELVDGPRLLSWLAARGVTYPLEEFEKMRLASEASNHDWERWAENMPACLRPFSEMLRGQVGWGTWVSAPDFAASGPGPSVDQSKEQDSICGIEKLRAALEAAYPDGVSRALALMQWLGHGTGLWNGYPSYEQVADELLLGVSRDDLVASLSRPDLSEAQQEGGARFLAGHDARAFRGSVLNRLSGDIRHRLLEQALKSADEDKKKRAIRFLGGRQES